METGLYFKSEKHIFKCELQVSFTKMAWLYVFAMKGFFQQLKHDTGVFLLYSTFNGHLKYNTIEHCNQNKTTVC